MNSNWRHNAVGLEDEKQREAQKVMKVVFVLPTVNMSGGLRVVAIYAAALTERGHEVTLVSPPPRQMPFRRKIFSLATGRGWPTPTAKKPSHIDELKVEHRVLDRWRPVENRDIPDSDVIIATWWETAEWVNNLKSSNGAKIYFVQGHEIYPHLPVGRCKATYRMPFHKIVVSKWLADIMLREYGDPFVDLVPNSVDHQLFFAPERGKQNRPTIGFLYSKSSNKGVDVSLEVIRRLHGRFPNLRVISFGTTNPSWSKEQSELIEFNCLPPQHVIRNLYSECDVWLTTSRMEGFNLTAIEAMACRTPVVSTNTGWPADAVVIGHNGALCDVDDVVGLTQGVECILAMSDAEWRTVSENAFATVKNSSWTTSANLFEAALQHACQRAA